MLNYSLQICAVTEGQCVNLWVKTPLRSSSKAILQTKCLCSCWDVMIQQRKPHQGAGPASLRMTGLNTVNLQHSVFTRGALISSFLLLETCFAPAAWSGLQTLGRFRVMGELTGCLAGNSASKWCRSIEKSCCLIRLVAGWREQELHDGFNFNHSERWLQTEAPDKSGCCWVSSLSQVQHIYSVQGWQGLIRTVFFSMK